MLIDTSYFTGPLTIAQLGSKSVDDRVTDFIDLWEPVIMEAAMGYDFYQAFLDGLDVGSDEIIEQRWLDLLNGVAFTAQGGKKSRWVGFTGGANTNILVPSQRADLFIYAGITPGFPVGGYQYTNSDLTGWNFSVELFGAGTLDPETEWVEKAGGGISLTNTTYTTTAGERWVIKFTSKKIVTIPSGGQNLFSPLAGFIYYEYMRDLATQNTGSGTVKATSENSYPVSAAQKMIDAYNMACRQMAVLASLLRTDQAKPVAERTYPEFNYSQISYYYDGYCNDWTYWEDSLYSFRPINTFGI